MYLNQPAFATHSNGLVPPLWSYALFSGLGTTGDIELIDVNGRTLAFIEGFTVPVNTATTLRAAVNSNTNFDNAVGALVRFNADVIFNTCVSSEFVIPGGVAPKASSLSKFLANTVYAVSWGG